MELSCKGHPVDGVVVGPGSLWPPIQNVLQTGGYWAPAFFRTGDEMRSKAVHRGKKGTKLVFSPKLVLRGVSSSVLDLPYLLAHPLH